MKKLLTLLILMTGLLAKSFAQNSNIIKSDSLNPLLQKLAKPESQPTFIKFRDDIKINPQTLFTEYSQAFNLKDDDKMNILKVEKDDIGFTHFQYEQFYKNVRIDEGIIKVHTNKDGITYAVNGKILTGININVVPDISSKQAIELAQKFINAKEYKWQSKFWENEIKVRTQKTDTSYYPLPQLVIRQIKNNNAQSDAPTTLYHLAYRLDIYTSSPDYSQCIFIDAHTGEVLEVFPLQSN